MSEFFNIKHYTLDSISEHRRAFIDMKLSLFLSLYNITKWPIDCATIFKIMNDQQLIRFTYGFANLPNKFDAITEHKAEHNLYITLINRNKVNYPFQSSRDRRLNFTLAHEIGHIILEHLLIAPQLKTEEEKELEEIEANEFAGKLLMPAKLINSCNFYSIDAVAEYFKVSKAALWIRLNNLKRLNLLSSRKIRTCPCCGNTNFSIFSEYCGICGTPLSNGLKGELRIKYPEEIPTDKHKRVLICPKCKQKIATGEKCSTCGTYIFNFCSDYITIGYSGCNAVHPGNFRYCEYCGKPTYFYTKGFIGDWDSDNKNNYNYEFLDECYGDSL